MAAAHVKCAGVLQETLQSLGFFAKALQSDAQAAAMQRRWQGLA